MGIKIDDVNNDYSDTTEVNDINNDIPVINTAPVAIEEKEEKLQTSEYMQNVLTDKQVKDADELSATFDAFLSKEFDIKADSSIKTTIPTGIDLLDVLSGGGFATSLVQLVGPPGCGKTALACRVLATGQKKFAGKFMSAFLDSEESMTVDRLIQLGVSQPRIQPHSDMTVEKTFKMIEAMCVFKENNPAIHDVPSAIVWDSIANTMTEKGSISDDINTVLGEKARVLSHYLPKYVRKLNKYKICLVGINQLRDRIDMGQFSKAPDLKFLGDKNLPGGKSLLFNSVQLLLLRPGKAIGGDEGFGVNGFIVSCKFIKNKLFTPNIDFKLVFSFERGFSNFWTNFEMLKDTKRIRPGAWCTLLSYPSLKFRQKDSIKFYTEDPLFRAAFDADVKDALQTEYLDKYLTGNTSTTDVF